MFSLRNWESVYQEQREEIDVEASVSQGLVPNADQIAMILLSGESPIAVLL